MSDRTRDRDLPMFVSRAQAARWLSLDPRVLGEAAKRGELKVYNFGEHSPRFKLTDLAAWVASRAGE
ncbi:MAG: hypothetical protein LBS56_10320 [Propionibacteriaceae bacterium]|jgi:hypothetical protein|nr:hypothetical protein [Propionibacteriaceae bacterium]